ncbi:MAG: TSUP family transporter [Alphaproteobacteria bacterium]|nr:TSUP family transporter [Alphaproteobacteria bacterium]
MTVSLATSLLILVTVFATSIVSGILGMAGGVMLMGLLVWVLPVSHAMILHAVAQLSANSSRAWIHRHHIYRKGLLWYFAGAAVTFCVFAAITLVPSKLAVFVLLGVGPFISYLLPKKLELDITKPAHACACGAVVTGLQLTCGVAGPAQALFFQTDSLTRHETVATKAFMAATSHLTKFVYFGFIAGSLSQAASGVPLWLFAALIPAALIGTKLSKSILARISDKQFYHATQGILFVIGVVYLQKAFMLWLNG